jgi:hypothetical protein
MSLDKINKQGKYRQYVSTRNYFLAEKWGITPNVFRAWRSSGFLAQKFNRITAVEPCTNVS